MSSKYGGSSRAQALLRRRPPRESTGSVPPNQPSTDGSFSLGNALSVTNINLQSSLSSEHVAASSNTNVRPSNVAAHHANTSNNAHQHASAPLPHKMKRRPSPKRKREHGVNDPVQGLQTQFRSWDLLSSDKNTTFRRNVLGQPAMSPELVVQGNGQQLLLHRTPPFQTSAFSPTSASTDDTVTPSSIASGTPSPNELEVSPQALYSADRRRGMQNNFLGFHARASHTIKDPSRSHGRRKRRSGNRSEESSSSSSGTSTSSTSRRGSGSNSGSNSGSSSSSSSSSSKREDGPSVSMSSSMMMMADRGDGPIAASHAIDFDTPSKSLAFNPRHSVPPRSARKIRRNSPNLGPAPTPRNSIDPAFGVGAAAQKTASTPSPHQTSIPREPRTAPDRDFGHKVSHDVYNDMTPTNRLTQSAGRPVPNQSVFESSANELMESHASERTDATPNKKVCPPTPQRTPTWMAQSHNSGRNRDYDDDEDDDLLHGGDSMDGFGLGGGRAFNDVNDDPLCLSDLQDDGGLAAGERRMSAGGRRRGSSSHASPFASKMRDEDQMERESGESGGGYGYFNDADEDATMRDVDDHEEEEEGCGGSVPIRRGSGRRRSFRGIGQDHTDSNDILARHFDFSGAAEDGTRTLIPRTAEDGGRRREAAASSSSSERRRSGGDFTTLVGRENESSNSNFGSSKFDDNPTSSSSIFGVQQHSFVDVNNNGHDGGPGGGRAAGLRAGSVSTYDDDSTDPRILGWNPPSRHRVLRTNSLEGNKVLINLNGRPGSGTDGRGDIGSTAPVVFDQTFVNHGILGSGAFSDVFKALDKADGKLYAVKRSKKRFKNKTERDRYLQEPRMYKKLTPSGMTKCQNVLEYYRAWQEEGFFYTQTELCPGGNLKNLLEVCCFCYLFW